MSAVRFTLSVRLRTGILLIRAGRNAMTWIGLNMDVEGESNRALRHRINHSYIHAVRETGAAPLLIPAGALESELRKYLVLVGAVIFIGGADYPPDFYNVEPHPETRTLHPRRAGSDLQLARRVLFETSLPVLAICGGMQLVVITHGGGLIQHVANAGDHRPSKAGEIRRHNVLIEPGTSLRTLLGCKRVEVNSFHHQAADPARLPSSLRVAARAEDGTIEAVEGTDPERFLVAVQWHPENMDEDHRRRLFGGLLAAAQPSIR